MTSVISVRDVSKSFGPTRAVIDLDLEVPRGSLCGFLGPNGAGKSTTIRMIMSIFHADRGAIDVLGTSALNAKDRIGYLPEERGVYRKMRVGAFIEYIARLKGVPRKGLRSRVEQWLERVELPDARQKRCEELSKGMQQKVQFLSAIIHDPEVIILDEPFSGLDPVNAQLIGSIIEELRVEGRTILFSTHVLPQAERICDRIVMIDQGIKVLDGPIDEIRAQFDPRVIKVDPVEPDHRYDDVVGVAGVESRDGHLHLRIADDAQPTDVLSAVVAHGPVRSACIAQPTLDEIFIEQVFRSRGSDAAAETREELTHG